MAQINLWEDLVEDLAYSMGYSDRHAVDNCEPLPHWEELYHRNPNDGDYFPVSSDDDFDPDVLCASGFSPMGNNIDGSSFTSDPVGPEELLGWLHATGSLNITQPKDGRSHIEVASSKTQCLVKDSFPYGLCSREAILSVATNLVEGMVNGNNNEIHASQTRPTSNVDNSSTYEPSPSHKTAHMSNHMPSQQSKDEQISDMCHTREDEGKRTTKKHYSARDSTKQGGIDGGIHAKHSRSWAGRSNKRGSYSRQSFKRKYPIILGRDFLLIDRKVQSNLIATKAFWFFHRLSFSPVEIHCISRSYEDPMNCDPQAFTESISTVDELTNTSSGESILMSIGDIETPPMNIEATLAHQGSTVRNLKSKRIIAFKEDVSKDVFFQDYAAQHLQKSPLPDQNPGSDKVKGEESEINVVESRITNSGDGGLHMACSSNHMLRYLRSVRLKASKNSSAKKRGRHLGTSEICRIRRRFSRLKNIDGGQSVKPSKEFARHKRKRTHSIEDSYFDPHVFRAPQRRALP